MTTIGTPLSAGATRIIAARQRRTRQGSRSIAPAAARRRGDRGRTATPTRRAIRSRTART
ncbi:MAG: hypothetical protein MZV65_52700 [Chromatiales bacterium]|nr:hypothetical protein [Chromatiales bacterium]